MEKRYHFEPDNRRNPKTNRYCINCHKDIKSGSDYYKVSVDWDKLELWPDNDGEHKVGSNCMRKIKKRHNEKID